MGWAQHTLELPEEFCRVPEPACASGGGSRVFPTLPGGLGWSLPPGVGGWGVTALSRLIQPLGPQLS